MVDFDLELTPYRGHKTFDSESNTKKHICYDKLLVQCWGEILFSAYIAYLKSETICH